LDAAISAIAGEGEYRLRQIQPPADRIGGHQGDYGGGWKAVLSWCRDHSEAGHSPLFETILLNADYVVVHLDAEIAKEPELADADLLRACPPASDTVARISEFVLSQLGTKSGSTVAKRVIMMIPAQTTEAWIIAAFFSDKFPDLGKLECFAGPDVWLSTRRPRFVRDRGDRMQKLSSTYRELRSILVTQWPTVREACACAEALSVMLAESPA